MTDIHLLFLMRALPIICSLLCIQAVRAALLAAPRRVHDRRAVALRVFPVAGDNRLGRDTGACTDNPTYIYMRAHYVVCREISAVHVF